MCRRHHTYGRKWRISKEPLDEDERGEWKTWLKAQHSENEYHGIWSHHFMGNRWRNSGGPLFWGAPKSLQMVTATMKLKGTWSLKEKLWPTLVAYWKTETTLPTKVCLVKAVIFPVVMYGCESWTIKKAKHWRIDAFELCGVGEDPKSLLDCKEIKPVNPKGNQSWIFIAGTDAKAEAPILWPPDGKSWLHLKRPWWRERLKAGGEGDDRGWDGWMASPTRHEFE